MVLPWVTAMSLQYISLGSDFTGLEAHGTPSRSPWIKGSSGPQHASVDRSLTGQPTCFGDEPEDSRLVFGEKSR